MNEISTGLDSSTTYQIVNSLRRSVHILGGTALIALLQPAPETYELFDDIVLLSDGQIVYQDPRENVLQFFEAMGFKCPERKGVADFLQEVSKKNETSFVTSRKDQHQYWENKDEPYRYISVNEFAEAFQSFHAGHKLGEELSIPFDRRQNHPAALTTTTYGISKMALLKACISREWLLMKRNSFVYIFEVVQLIILGAIAMTVFLSTKMHRNSVEDGVIFLGAMFLGLVTHLFYGFAELAMSIAKLPIFYKQRDLRFYPSWADTLPTWILKIPISFLECAVRIGMTYYVIGFDPNIERFFRHYLLLVLISQMASGLFRLLAAVGREMVVADTFGSSAQLVLLILSGFLISRALGNGQAVISEEALRQKQANRTGEGVEPSLTGSNSPKRGTTKGGEGGRARQNEISTHNKRKGMMLPFAPLSITFDNVRYSVDMPQEMKDKGIEDDRLVLLKGVSGAFRPGVLTALMGVSEAGKTTLMDVLAGRKTGEYIDGNIYISGYPKKQETFARISGYCEQNDIHSPHVTVYESLLYSAWLRLPPEVDSETRKMFIEEVMELVELTSD
ncbi:hypothetical protein OPV22_030885 [Ensete ventricosum]|uniref:ABC transporter domain-containing protein n=1 Tax=Ensete ventricosum TaxID=4639 RepID=A0AAV8PIE6_ENSVE|nr:hypothetical protein OPV22_030885 [Ensete ventricosum]